MLESGEYVETPPDAPTYDFDDAFWGMIERNLERQVARESVHLRIDPETLAYFKSKGPDHLAKMADALKDYASDKKAS